MSEGHILKFDELPKVARGGGIETVPLAGPRLGAKGISTGITRFPAGTSVPEHTHNVEEAVTLLEGEGTVEIEGKQTPVKPWDSTYIPAGVPHRFINSGNGRMSILFVYGGTHVTRTFVATGETVVQLSEEDKVG
jgi:quercetin dioxygenase-like cupin family protein